jgi:hypothetical protein
MPEAQIAQGVQLLDLMLEGTVNLSGRLAGCRRSGLGIEIYCQPMLQISSQTWNVWFLEALCSAAVT